MTVDYAQTGELVEQMFGDIFQGLAHVFLMSDDEMFAGLDSRTIARLRQCLSDDPNLRPTLCRAAHYRAGRRQREPRREPSQVYFIQAEASGLVKIGCASDPIGRLASLQTGSPDRLRLLASAPGGQMAERDLHRRFAASRQHGEWFRPSVELMGLIEEVSR